MTVRWMSALAGLGVLALTVPGASAQTSAPAFRYSAPLKAAVADARRTPENVLRDRYRHPYETLRFFGVEPNDTVVEIWPSRGWYTEILAPYLSAGGGKLLLATPNGQLGPIAQMQKAHPAIYGNLSAGVFPAFTPDVTRIPDGTADVVLTFRNVHNWRMGSGHAEKQDYSADAFRQMYAMLKPGGVLGVVDHRLPESASDERERTSGYVKVSTVRRLAEAAGFRLAGSSEVNANPKDTTDWPRGVWTLPPAYRLGDQDKAKYAAVGESDRMTLKFVKPR
ncbi:class I SAM-dependent methyltransferase [Sphingomonas lutea]|nr:methyltransferase [Sphingomonas lutea]